MRLIKLVVSINGNEIINSDLFANGMKGENASDDCYYSLILGENGVGKSRFLKLIQDVFLYLEKAQKQNRKPKSDIDAFYIVYEISGKIISVRKENSRTIEATSDGLVTDYKTIEIPHSILGVSFMVEDKFFFSSDATSSYKYLGVRSSANSTYTSSISRKLGENIAYCFKGGKDESIRAILHEIGLEEFLRLSLKSNTKKTASIFSPFDLNQRRELISALDEYESENPRQRGIGEKSRKSEIVVELKKKGQSAPISFSLLSSGEKHLLFALFGILRYIENESLVLIDEPEISLHPEWQIRYISTLRDILSKYKKCHFWLASHSHYFVSDLPADNSSLLVFKRTENEEDMKLCPEIIPYSTNAWSAENIIYNVFGMRTSRNYYFEKDVQALINLLASGSTALDRNLLADYVGKLKKYELNGDDPLKSIISKAEDMLL